MVSRGGTTGWEKRGFGVSEGEYSMLDWLQRGI